MLAKAPARKPPTLEAEYDAVELEHARPAVDVCERTADLDS
jgi:hypothetical protein